MNLALDFNKVLVIVTANSIIAMEYLLDSTLVHSQRFKNTAAQVSSDLKSAKSPLPIKDADSFPQLQLLMRSEESKLSLDTKVKCAKISNSLSLSNSVKCYQKYLLPPISVSSFENQIRDRLRFHLPNLHLILPPAHSLPPSSREPGNRLPKIQIRQNPQIHRKVHFRWNSPFHLNNNLRLIVLQSQLRSILSKEFNFKGKIFNNFKGNLKEFQSKNKRKI